MFHAVTTKGAAPRPHLTAALGEAGRAAVGAWLATLEDYRPTPLVALPALAAANGVASIHVKDEGQRLGLKSFKALGGAYAVASLVLAEAGEQAWPQADRVGSRLARGPRRRRGHDGLLRHRRQSRPLGRLGCPHRRLPGGDLHPCRRVAGQGRRDRRFRRRDPPHRRQLRRFRAHRRRDRGAGKAGPSSPTPRGTATKRSR